MRLPAAIPCFFSSFRSLPASPLRPLHCSLATSPYEDFLFLRFVLWGSWSSWGSRCSSRRRLRSRGSRGSWRSSRCGLSAGSWSSISSWGGGRGGGSRCSGFIVMKIGLIEHRSTGSAHASGRLTVRKLREIQGSSWCRRISRLSLYILWCFGRCGLSLSSSGRSGRNSADRLGCWKNFVSLMHHW